MSKEFEKWYLWVSEDEDVLMLDKTSLFVGFNAGMDVMQAKLDAQAKDIEALRGFAKHVLDTASEGAFISARVNWILLCGEAHNLLDENGNPTKLLTGSD